MRALPLTDKTRPGGRPRSERAPSNAFADWLRTCGMKPEDVAARLGKLVGEKVSVSTVYNMRNAWFKPGRELAAAIEEMARDGRKLRSAVPVSSWQEFEVRARPAKKVA